MMRLLAAVAVALIVYLVLERTVGLLMPAAGTLVGAQHQDWLLAAIAGLEYFIAIAAGASVARGPFLFPAIALWAAAMITAMNTGYRLQIADAPISVAEYASRQLPSIGLTLAGTLCGVVCGGLLARRLKAWSAR